jgi:hypothetical protein
MFFVVMASGLGFFDEGPRQLPQFWNKVAVGSPVAGFSVPCGQRLALGRGPELYVR